MKVPIGFLYLLLIGWLLAILWTVATLHAQAPLARYALVWTWADPALSWSAGFRYELTPDPAGAWVKFEDLPATCR